MLVVVNSKKCTIYQDDIKTTIKNEDAILKIIHASCVVVNGKFIGQTEMVYIDGDNDAHLQKELKQTGISFKLVKSRDD